MLDEFNNNQEVFEKKKSKSKFSSLLIIFGGLCITGVFGYFVYYQYIQDGNNNVLSQDESQEFTVESSYVFEYTLVPNAQSVVVPVIANEAQMKTNDRTVYEKMLSDMESGQISFSEKENDSPYEIKEGVLGILTILDNHQNKETVFKIHDELVALTNYYNTKLKKDSPQQRGVADKLMLPYEVANQTISPSLHVVLALYFADIIKGDLPDGYDSNIDTDVEDLIKRGIVYGLYADSDVAISRSLYLKYKEQLLSLHPEFSSFLATE
jgi:hypothetical protein